MTPKKIAESAPIANPDEVEEAQGRYARMNLYRMWAGGNRETVVYIWAPNFDNAFEELTEWLDDNEPGHLADVTGEDYEAAAKELGYQWQDHWPDFEDPRFRAVVAEAEADMTPIGHTTLKHGQFIHGWEWGGDEVPKNSREFKTVAERSEEDAEED